MAVNFVEAYEFMPPSGSWMVVSISCHDGIATVMYRVRDAFSDIMTAYMVEDIVEDTDEITGDRILRSRNVYASSDIGTIVNEFARRSGTF